MHSSSRFPVVNGIQQSPNPPSPTSLPAELMGNAPWIFVVYCAFNAAWKPWEIILLVIALIPMAVLTSRAKRA